MKHVSRFTRSEWIDLALIAAVAAVVVLFILPYAGRLFTPQSDPAPLSPAPDPAVQTQPQTERQAVVTVNEEAVEFVLRAAAGELLRDIDCAISGGAISLSAGLDAAALADSFGDKLPAGVRGLAGLLHGPVALSVEFSLALSERQACELSISGMSIAGIDVPQSLIEGILLPPLQGYLASLTQGLPLCSLDFEDGSFTLTLDG